MKKTKNVQTVEKNEATEDQLGTNSQRTLKGWQIGISILVMIAFWGTFAYAILVKNMELVKIFAYIIAFGVGVFGTIHFVTRLFQDLSKK
jgi:hypothetical protein